MEYHDVFRALWRFPSEYHIAMDPKVQPMQHYPRKAAVALEPEIKKKMNEFVEREILGKVTFPTKWISSLMKVKNPSKL